MSAAPTVTKEKRSKANGHVELKIEDGIPIPRGRTLATQFGSITEMIGKLKVGQSILLPMFTKPEQLGGVRTHCQGKFQIKLATRAVEGGVRVWRTE